MSFISNLRFAHLDAVHSHFKVPQINENNWYKKILYLFFIADFIFCLNQALAPFLLYVVTFNLTLCPLLCANWCNRWYFPFLVPLCLFHLFTTTKSMILCGAFFCFCFVCLFFFCCQLSVGRRRGHTSGSNEPSETDARPFCGAAGCKW